MLMSKSRLEKFLYALYSLDSSDLPNPLSRIEELYKCWVTGEEAPTFEPLSRVEKYLMAILGVYDVDSLPNPLSRVEVLIYKLATGDDNLDDVKSFLSEHEELLAEIIRNGGAGGNINIEYVLYTLTTKYSTLYNTAEKPVKSAILKGQTLVNLVGEKRFYTNNGASNLLRGWEFMLPYNLTKGKTYLAVFNATGTISDTNSKVYLMDNKFNSTTGNTDYHVDFKAGYNMVKCVASGDNHRVLRIRTKVETSGDFEVSDVMLIEYQEGMENWDIPYFEGMKSVQMPVLTTYNSNIFPFKEYIEGTGATEDKDYIYVKGNFDFIIPLETDGNIYTLYVDGEVIKSDNFGEWKFIFEDGTERGDYLNPSKTSFDTLNKKLIGLKLRNPFNAEFKLKKSSLCFNLKSKGQEPHKSNILTVNEEVELRGIGDVQDELDLLTGELTECIGEIVLDETSKLSLHKRFSEQGCVSVRLNLDKPLKVSHPLICDKLPYITFNDLYNGIKGIATNSEVKEVIYFCVSVDDAEKCTINDVKQQILANPLTIQYPLATESIKTVDLSVVDQDGNDTKLSTFNDITHVTLSSEGLIPEAELEVATKNEEVLNTMSLEMDDISTTQNDLQETSNTQSENVDATMIATTEIYEGLL